MWDMSVHYTSLYFCMCSNFLFFFLKMGFHHVGQAGLELSTSGDLPALASKVFELQA